MSELGKQRLARLLEDQRSAFGEIPNDFAARFSMTGRSMEYWMSGRVAPRTGRRAAIENGIGWRPGIITQILEDDVAEFWGLDDVRIPDPSQQPVARASQLTDDELLTEVTRRFKTYADKATETPARSQEHFGLAAHHDPTETKTPKRRRPPKT